MGGGEQLYSVAGSEVFKIIDRVKPDWRIVFRLLSSDRLLKLRSGRKPIWTAEFREF